MSHGNDGSTDIRRRLLCGAEPALGPFAADALTPGAGKTGKLAGIVGGRS
jgi:hypothetical protein